MKIRVLLTKFHILVYIEKTCIIVFMKKFLILFFVLISLSGVVFASGTDASWRRLAVYNFKGEGVLALSDLSVEYYSPKLIIVRDKNNMYYRADISGKPLDADKYLVLGYPLIVISDGNFVQLIKAKSVQDNEAEMIIYNKQGEVVFPLDKLKNYEPLGFKYLKDGRIIAVKKQHSDIVVFEAGKPQLLLDSPEKLADWLNKNKIDTTDYKGKWTEQMSPEEKMLTIEHNIFENWLNNPSNIYMAPADDKVVFQTRDGNGIRSRRYPTNVFVKPNPEYQNIVIQGGYYTYFSMGTWKIQSFDSTVTGSARFKNLPIIRGEYVYIEE